MVAGEASGELVEMLLRAQNRWDGVVHSYLLEGQQA